MLTICFITNRKQPKIDWFLDSLINQYDGSLPIEIIVVTAFMDAVYEPIHTAVENLSQKFPNKVINIRLTHPPPSPVQGKYRLTSENWFSAANARNTGIVYATGNYIMYVDDLSVLMPTWLEAVTEAYDNGYVLEGAYSKDRNMVVENGILLSSETESIDSRWTQCGEGKQQGRDSWLFGCSVGVPTNILLELNGWDTITDTIGYEDCIMGIRLRRLGCQFIYDKRAYTTESSELHFTEGNTFRREDEETDSKRYFRILDNYGVKRTTHKKISRYDSSHAMIDIAEKGVLRCAGNKFDLTQLRGKVANGEKITPEDMCFPTHHWFSGKAFSEM